MEGILKELAHSVATRTFRVIQHYPWKTEEVAPQEINQIIIDEHDNIIERLVEEGFLSKCSFQHCRVYHTPSRCNSFTVVDKYTTVEIYDLVRV